jgi:hypothetical protein
MAVSNDHTTIQALFIGTESWLPLSKIDVQVHVTKDAPAKIVY